MESGEIKSDMRSTKIYRIALCIVYGKCSYEQYLIPKGILLQWVNLVGFVEINVLNQKQQTAI